MKKLLSVLLITVSLIIALTSCGSGVMSRKDYYKDYSELDMSIVELIEKTENTSNRMFKVLNRFAKGDMNFYLVMHSTPQSDGESHLSPTLYFYVANKRNDEVLGRFEAETDSSKEMTTALVAVNGKLYIFGTFVNFTNQYYGDTEILTGFKTIRRDGATRKYTVTAELENGTIVTDEIKSGDAGYLLECDIEEVNRVFFTNADGETIEPIKDPSQKEVSFYEYEGRNLFTARATVLGVIAAKNEYKSWKGSDTDTFYGHDLVFTREDKMFINTSTDALYMVGSDNSVLSLRKKTAFSCTAMAEYDDKLYFIDGGKKIMFLDYSDNSISQLTTTDNNIEDFVMLDGKIYLFAVDNSTFGTNEIIDVNTKSRSWFKVSSDETINGITVAEDKLILKVTVHDGTKKTQMIYVSDKDGNITKKINLPYEGASIMMGRMYFIDGRFIFAMNKYSDTGDFTGTDIVYTNNLDTEELQINVICSVGSVTEFITDGKRIYYYGSKTGNVLHMIDENGKMFNWTGGNVECKGIFNLSGDRLYVEMGGASRKYIVVTTEWSSANDSVF